MKVVITGTIPGRFEYPDKRFSNFCWESWGNVWSSIDGVECEFVSHKELLSNTELFNDIDIFMATMDLEEVLDHAFEKCFVIMVEHGSGHKIDILTDINKKFEFINQMRKADIILSSTHAGKYYMSMYTETPVLDIPVPIDTSVFCPRGTKKYEDFTICIGETINASYDDRPLQFQAISMAKKIGAKIVTSLYSEFSITKEDIFKLTGTNEDDIMFFPHASMLDMSLSYLPKCHVSMMVSQRTTFGRFTYISSAIGVPCISSKFMMQDKINNELSFVYNDLEQIEKTLLKLRDDKLYYKHCRDKSLNNIKQMNNESIAIRICNEILPIYNSLSHKFDYMKWTNGTDHDLKIISDESIGIETLVPFTPLF